MPSATNDHAGLHAEEISHTSEQLGQIPTAFTHPAVISAAFDLDRSLYRRLTGRVPGRPPCERTGLHPFWR
ncbi:hypothetical protein ADK77_06185 [Streptomyces antibioticus]|nr:hypothetical protein ADK77_06185 [Streptomyces antibioticus]